MFHDVSQSYLEETGVDFIGHKNLYVAIREIVGIYPSVRTSLHLIDHISVYVTLRQAAASAYGIEGYSEPDLKHTSIYNQSIDFCFQAYMLST